MRNGIIQETGQLGPGGVRCTSLPARVALRRSLVRRSGGVPSPGGNGRACAGGGETSVGRICVAANSGRPAAGWRGMACPRQADGNAPDGPACWPMPDQERPGVGTPGQPSARNVIGARRERDGYLLPYRTERRSEMFHSPARRRLCRIRQRRRDGRHTEQDRSGVGDRRCGPNRSLRHGKPWPAPVHHYNTNWFRRCTMN